MGKTIQKTMIQKDMERAQQLMRIYAQSSANKKALEATIKNELEAYKKNMKDAEEELMELAERLRTEFDNDNNLVFDDGYLHIATNTVIKTTRKFDLATFYAVQPDMVKFSLAVAPIKKAFLDKDLRKELKALGVETDTEEVVQVIVK